MTIYFGDGTTQATAGTAGKVLQVQSTIKTSTYTEIISSGSYGSDMSLNVNITPASSSNKVMVFVNCNLGMTSDARVGFVVYRDGSVIDGWRGTSSEGDSRARVAASGRTPSNHHMVPVSAQYLDSPSSTSQVTYSVRGVTPDGYRFYLNRMEGSGGTPGNSWGWPIASSTITVMEIAG